MTTYSNVSDGSRTANDTRGRPPLDDPALEHLSSLVPVCELNLNDLECNRRRLVDIDGQRRLVEYVAGILFRTLRHHVVLCGPRGVGKSSVLLRLGEEILSEHFQFLSDYRVLYVDASNVGEEDSRAFLETLFSGIRERHRVLLIIDGLSSLFRRPAGGTNKALIRALLSRPGLRMVATMLPDEYADCVANDALMLGLITRVDCPDVSEAELRSILRHRADDPAEQSTTIVSDEVLHRIITLSSTFLIGEHEPARSLEVLRTAIDSRDYEQREKAVSAADLTVDDVVNVLSERTGIPTDTIRGLHRNRDFLKALTGRIYGQPAAVAEVAVELELIAAGLNDPGKPATVLMFAGLTGVGKTELARLIARLYSPSGHLRTYPMGNFTEPHSVSGLIGVPPGYVGHEDGGRLVNDLLADPYSVFLLDEAEKCHPNVWKPFLTLFDEGWIIDQRGRKAYGDRAIFILTTNAGDRSIGQLHQSGRPAEEITDQVRRTLSRVRHERSSQPVFPPQFLSRIRRIIVFNPLDCAAMIRIAEAMAVRITDKWKRIQGKPILISEDVIQWIGQEAHRINSRSNGEEGGRVVQKLMSDRIEYEILKLVMKDSDACASCRRILVSRSDDETQTLKIVFCSDDAGSC